MTLYEEVIAARESDFFQLASADAQKDILRAKMHGPDTPLPPYAVFRVREALREIRKTNNYHSRQVEKIEKAPKGYKGGRKKQHGKKNKASAA